MFYTIHRAVKFFLWCCVFLVAWKIYERRDVFEPGVLWYQVWDNGGFNEKRPNAVAGRVLRVINSQTFMMSLEGGRRLNVRMMGLREPSRELTTKMIERENKRRRALEEMIEEKTVRIDVTYHSENNIGGVVYLKATNVNADLVLRGYASTEKSLVKGLPKEAQYELLWAQRHRVPLK